ncbi:MAG: hypothetical protein ABIW82_16815 [Dokdonella sp.]
MKNTNSPWALWLATCGNPDHGQDPDAALWGADRDHFIIVNEIADISTAGHAFIEENGLGGGNWFGGDIFDSSGGKVGRLAYNGRIFASDPESPFGRATAAAMSPAAQQTTDEPVRPEREVTAILVVSSSSAVDIQDAPAVDECSAVAIQWSEALRLRILHLSGLCGSFEFDSITTSLDAVAINGADDQALLERILSTRPDAPNDLPVILSVEDWDAAGAPACEPVGAFDAPRLRVTTSEWGVVCREVSTGVVRMSRGIPVDFDPLEVLRIEQNPSDSARSAAPGL